MKNSGHGEGDSRNRTHVQIPDRFSVNGFRYHRRWAVDVDYLKSLPEAERRWLQRFLREYYDAANKLLRPEQHEKKCEVCREGGDCGKRPGPALHNTDALRRDCYLRQKHSYWDAQSAGRVALWEDFDGVDTAGNVAKRGNTGSMGFESIRPRVEAGDSFADTGGGGDGPASSPLFRRLARRGR